MTEVADRGNSIIELDNFSRFLISSTYIDLPAPFASPLSVAAKAAYCPMVSMRTLWAWHRLRIPGGLERSSRKSFLFASTWFSPYLYLCYYWRWSIMKMASLSYQQVIERLYLSCTSYNVLDDIHATCPLTSYLTVGEESLHLEIKKSCYFFDAPSTSKTPNHNAVMPIAFFNRIPAMRHWVTQGFYLIQHIVGNYIKASIDSDFPQLFSDVQTSHRSLILHNEFLYQPHRPRASRFVCRCLARQHSSCLGDYIWYQHHWEAAHKYRRPPTAFY